MQEKYLVNKNMNEMIKHLYQIKLCTHICSIIFESLRIDSFLNLQLVIKNLL